MKNDIAQKLHHSPGLGISLGCMDCPERDLCGGLEVSGDHYDCLVFCECEDPSRCDLACPNNLEVYIQRQQEVRGFSLDNIPHIQVLPFPKLPASVPVIYHGSKRVRAVSADAVAIPLSYIFNRKTGSLRFTTREQLADHFGVNPTAKLVIVGADQDDPIEDYWALRQAGHTPERLAALRPDLMTVPNFSLPLDVVRHDNLHNMKRIALCWSELMSAGIPTALHVNARTDRDWDRWTQLITEHSEVRSVSFEYATGPKRQKWGEWYTRKLVQLATTVPRRLQLITRGGYPYLALLRAAFSHVTFLDTTSFMRTVHRQKLQLETGKHFRWVAAPTGPREMLDDLLTENLKNMMRVVENRHDVESMAVEIPTTVNDEYVMDTLQLT